jgi:Flp pilus assembly protein TadG
MIRQRSGGQSLVEFALILPVLMLLMVAVIDFGRAFKYSLQLHDAAFQGARAAGIVRATDAEVRAAIRVDLPVEVDVPDSDITITPGSRLSGTTVTVTVRWQYQPLIPLSRTNAQLPLIGNVVAALPLGSPLVGTGATVVR